VEGGGMTLLHLACWHAHLPLAQYLLKFASEVMGEKACRGIVNAIDTAYNRSTPLIEVSRTIQGHLNDRLEICKLLVQHGATVGHVDMRGENCMHWAVRRERLPIVRFFVKCTDEAVFAANTRNTKKKFPVDLAEVNANEKPNTTTLTIYELLVDMKKGMNFRLKIQQQKARRIKEDQRVKDKQDLDRARVLEESRALTERVMGMNVKIHQQAEKIRGKDRAAVVKKAGEEAITNAEEWLVSADEGKEFLEEHIAMTTKEFKQLIKEGKMKKPRNMRNECIAKVKAHLFVQRELDAQTVEGASFDERNPPIVLDGFEIPPEEGGEEEDYEEDYEEEDYEEEEEEEGGY